MYMEDAVNQFDFWATTEPFVCNILHVAWLKSFQVCDEEKYRKEMCTACKVIEWCLLSTQSALGPRENNRQSPHGEQG